MKTIIYVSILSGLACFGWHMINQQQNASATQKVPAENYPPAASPTSSREPSRPSPMSMEKVDAFQTGDNSEIKNPLKKRKDGRMDLEFTSERLGKSDKMPIGKLVNPSGTRPTSDSRNIISNSKAETGNFFITGQAPAVVAQKTDKQQEKKILTPEEDAELKAKLSKTNNSTESELQNNLKKIQDTVNQY